MKVVPSHMKFLRPRIGLVINLVMIIVVTGLMYVLLGRVFTAELMPG